MMPPKRDLIKNDLNSTLMGCQNYIRTLHGVTFERNKILEWFKVFCDDMTKLITLIGNYYKEDKERLQSTVQNTLVLYLTQILSAVSLLINIFVKEEEIEKIIREARSCIIKQMVCCYESIGVTLNTGKCPSDPSGNFVKWMDAALDKISQVNPKNRDITETRQLFEEVLSHAMSIAQVSLAEDSKIIRGSCQSVLQALNFLSGEVEKSPLNGAMLNLFVDTCSDKLCKLERKVNTAVLKLCLKTFSEYTMPLEKIHDFCFDSLNKRKIEDLDGLVADFDLHVDRIMQIGLFAVSCSSDCVRGIKIRSCLASLEALESELVPSMTSVLLDTTIHNINCAGLLMDHWVSQALRLQQLIYTIIDPFAFCQIVYEEGAEIIDSLSSNLKKKNLLKHEDFACFIGIMKVLQSFFDKAQAEFDENETRKVSTKLKDFNDVTEEVQSASKLLLLSGDNHTFENCNRVLKRCKIVLTVLKRLWYCFVDDINPDKILTSDILPVSPEAEVMVEPTGNAFLDHIINRGKQILQDRSVLYRTPIKKSTTKSTRKEIPLSRLIHLRNLSFLNVSTKETSLDLQITDILGEISNISTKL